MRLNIATILAFGLAKSFTTAFSPSSLLVRIPSSGTRLNVEQPRPAFPDVKLPEGEIPDAIPFPLVRKKVAAFLGPVLGTLPGLMGKSKEIPFTAIQESLKTSQGLGKQLPDPEAYNFFGINDHSKNLVTLLKSNPFFATALTERRGGFELRAFDPRDPDNEDLPPFYQKIVGTLTGAGHRVNIRFDSDMTKITRITVYDGLTGELIEKIRSFDEKELEYYASSALYNLLYYSSCIHATIHILHFFLTAALDYGSQDFEELNQWAQFYATNIPAKYIQVTETLIMEDPNPLTVLGPDHPDKKLLSLDETYALITGTEGFGGNGPQIRPILHEMLDMWVGDPTNFMENMMNISDERRKHAGILTEFDKHQALAAPFGSAVSEALRCIDADKLTCVESETKDYLKKCGLPSEIDTLEDWINLMAVTGIVHGGTLSYSRTFAFNEVLRWRNIQNPVWETGDIRVATIGTATIAGMTDHRHVFFSSTDTEGGTFAKGLQAVLDEYDGKSKELKEAYKKKITEDKKEFNKFGWILSDYCPDGFDGKQLTVATYI